MADTRASSMPPRTITLAEDDSEEVDLSPSKHEVMLASDIGKHLQLGVITTDKTKIAESREKWEKGNKRDQKVAVALNALEEGRTLVDLNTVIERGGSSPINHALPALAVVRADMSRVRVKVTKDGMAYYTGQTWYGGRFDMTFSIPFVVMGAQWTAAQAAAPVMPPDIRPAKPKKYLFLWEAGWRNIKEARPPIHIDPALLELVSGSIYRVVETWDLTEIEVSALR